VCTAAAADTIAFRATGLAPKQTAATLAVTTASVLRAVADPVEPPSPSAPAPSTKAEAVGGVPPVKHVRRRKPERSVPPPASEPAAEVAPLVEHRPLPDDAGALAPVDDTDSTAAAAHGAEEPSLPPGVPPELPPPPETRAGD